MSLSFNNIDILKSLKKSREVLKITAMNKALLETNIADSCDKLIRKYLEILKNDLNLNEIPIERIPYILMEPSGKGKYTGKECFLEEFNTDAIWQNIENTITNSEIWQEAKKSIKTFIDAYNIKPLGFPHDEQHAFLVPLLHSYLNETRLVTYDKGKAKKVTDQLITHLNSPGVNYVGLVVLENFSADKPFKLENDITIRPINKNDFKQLVDRHRFSSHYDHDKWIFNDYWVCEIKKMNPRGTFLGQNKISEMVHEDLSLAFRMFKEGDIGIRLGILKTLSIFEGSGISRATRTEHIALGKQSYYLSSKEIVNFIKFWKKLQGIINNKDHYLQVPLRRMLRSGTRREKEDSIIDCVIGLESLLGTKSEQTEISYKFRVRGSVLLAKRRIERPNPVDKLKELYNLRSNIAHGTHVTNKKIDEYLPFAEESLRTIWKWFFKHYYSARNNEEGINNIDCDLAVK
jgi:hypothetical protein